MVNKAHHYYFLCPQVYKSRGLKTRSLKQISWWLEVRVFVVEAERFVNQDRVEALYRNRQTLKQERGLTRIAGNNF